MRVIKLQHFCHIVYDYSQGMVRLWLRGLNIYICDWPLSSLNRNSHDFMRWVYRPMYIYIMLHEFLSGVRIRLNYHSAILSVSVFVRLYVTLHLVSSWKFFQHSISHISCNETQKMRTEISITKWNVTETRNMGQSPTWGRQTPQVRLEIQFRGL